MNSVILALSAVLIVLHYLSKWRLPRSFPPGPPNLPIIGGILHLSDDLLDSFQRLREKYGENSPWNQQFSFYPVTSVFLDYSICKLLQF